MSNFGDNVNWTGSVLGQSNTYGFGRLGWEPSTSSEEIHSDWAKQTFGLTEESQAGGLESVVSIMEDGWEVYENCTCRLSCRLSCVIFD